MKSKKYKNLPEIRDLVPINSSRGRNPLQAFHQTTGNRWVSVLCALNPLGPIAEAYGRTLAYKLEVKRLDVELEGVKGHAIAARYMIDSQLRLKIEELNQRHSGLRAIEQSINGELRTLQIERAEVLKMARDTHREALQAGLSNEERDFLYKMAMDLIRQLPTFGDRARMTLQNMIKALPPVPSVAGLLEE